MEKCPACRKEILRRILERMKKGSGNSFATEEHWIFKIVKEELEKQQ